MILSFALNFYVDNMDGYYPIHNPLMIAGIMALMFILIYGSMEISFIRMHQEIRAYLHDIDNQVLESTRKIQKQRKKYVLFFAILAVILLAMMILALIKAAQF
jgi:NADH:ubiquinone oxidoreductase subunit 6 (subunit J)